MLRNRAGFTLVEVIIALVITGVLGAAITSVFITQTTFYDRQEKVGSARGVSRGAMNLLTSELRMVERDSGVVEATANRLVLRVPFAMGVACGGTGTALSMRYLPTDDIVLNAMSVSATNVYSGHAWRGTDGRYRYTDSNTTTPMLGGVTADAVCTASGVRQIPGGGTLTLVTPSVAAVPIGAPVLLYQRVVYEFKNSAAVPGRRGLYRTTQRNNDEQELVAPFTNGARFNFYINDATAAASAPPTQLGQLTGVEIVLDGLSERPDRDGSHQAVPLSTSIFFRNRQ
jgi:prepilin-type N-terminal cleavage/methylation domain-containing protein